MTAEMSAVNTLATIEATVLTACAQEVQERFSKRVLYTEDVCKTTATNVASR